jgi:hypothetical protein
LFSSALLLVQPLLASRALAADPQERGTVYLETPGDTGSGSIVGRDGPLYLVVTNKHVVAAAVAGEDVVVGFHGGERVSVPATRIKRSAKYDIAFLEVMAKGCMGLFLLSEVDDPTGYPKRYPWRSLYETGGLEYGEQIAVSGFSAVDKSISDAPIYRKSVGNIAAILDSGKDGYRLGYTAPTARGMSGGPITQYKGMFSQHPYFHGIHGKGEADDIRSEQKTGMNFGIPALLIKQEAISLGLSRYLRLSYPNIDSSRSYSYLRQECG